MSRTCNIAVPNIVIVGAGLAGAQRERERQRVKISVVPSFDGVSIVGQF
ncbi:MAG: hypothetical protein HC888_15635 [Candidatus Competibacteraceae bacterium]|nr:hypothetical protein [Candidatus Competibacteraceae bacterium]